MTWRWLTCFELTLLAFAGMSQAASVSGRVEVIGDQGRHSQAHDSSVVIWLEPIPERTMPVNATARMIQKDKRFLPHVLPIEVGTVVDFPNLDPIFHNAFSSFDGQIFDIGLYAPSTSRSVRFSRKGIVRVFCNIHASMSAVIIVLDTPFFVTPTGDGRFVLQNVPPGDYTMRVFDERAKPETLASLAKPLKVTAGGLNLPPLSISEAGYLPVAHRNKYGMDYPPNAPDYLREE